MNNTIKHLPNGDFEVLYEAAEIHSDKGYQVSTHEKQAEFAKKREESLDEYRKQAMELWNDSCTSVRKK
jgi:hypothetical protein